MKSIIVILLLIVVSTSNSLGQSDVTGNNNVNFYETAFSTYLDSLESYFDPIVKLDSDWYNLNIEENKAITYFLSDTFKKYKIEVLNVDTIKTILQTSQEPIVMTNILPIQIKQNILTINFVGLEVSIKNNNLDEKIINGCTLDYRFNCDSNKFILEDADFWFVLE